jgi:hypothetical protein
MQKGKSVAVLPIMRRLNFTIIVSFLARYLCSQSVLLQLEVGRATLPFNQTFASVAPNPLNQSFICDMGAGSINLSVNEGISVTGLVGSKRQHFLKPQ